MKKAMVFLFCLCASVVASQALTIGAGPAIGTDKRGTIWYQELQDWGRGDVRALDTNDDEYKFNNSSDTARDLIAFYSHDDGTNVYFRCDFYEMPYGAENSELDVYVAIDCASGGQVWFPDYTDTQTDHPWEVCVGVYNSTAASVYDQGWTNHAGTQFLGSYWRSDLDGVEFGIRRSFLLAQGWNGQAASLFFQPFTCRDGTQSGAGDIVGRSAIVDHFGTLTPDAGGGKGLLSGAIPATATTGRAKYAVVAHANQSVAPQAGTQAHIFTDRSDLNLYPGFIRMLDSAEMLAVPVNLHISGTLLMALQWARQNPADSSYPHRDGPTFLARVSRFVTNGPGALVGGVLAEHIMPYFEGDVNRKSIEQNNELIQQMFGLSVADMGVMHTPERVIRSDTNSAYVSGNGPLDGKTFEDIAASGFPATYLDEVTHLHWWFYPNETNNPGWDDNNWGRWAGGQGNDEEAYHHKVHKINGVYCFMINDREDQAKFGNDDGGMTRDTRYTLLQKAMHADSAQLTLVFDDWEAFAGNSFASATPNNNADQWHNTLRWAANHPWIELVTLKQALQWATNDAQWVVDHGYVYDKTMQTYEWLKHASEHNYDHWYYGYTNASSTYLEENFFDRVPAVHNGWAPAGMKRYGDMNHPGTLLRDAWDVVQSISCTNLKKLAEWSYSAMIYETAWHDENQPGWWPPADKPWLSWSDAYQSRNYQATFNRAEANSYEDDAPVDYTSSWALRLHAHVRDLGVLKAAADWRQELLSGAQGPATRTYAADLDDDQLEEYVLCNNRVFACFERWGARLVKAFVFENGEVLEVIGVPVSNPAEESEEERADQNRCSAFKDRYSTGRTNAFVDMDFASPATPQQGSNSWLFTAQDGRMLKRVLLDNGRDVLRAEYQVAGDVGTLYSRHGIGPNQMNLMLRGPAGLSRQSDASFYGLRNAQGGAAYVVRGRNVELLSSGIANAGWEGRELPLVEQIETYNTATQFTLAIAFSLASASDLDGDGLPNTNEWARGTDHENPDSDGDGMSDGYEAAELLNPLSPADQGTDKDGDWVSNLDEYLANTHANASSSYLQVQAMAMEDGRVLLRTITTPQRRFLVHYADGLPAGPWRFFANTNNGVGSWMETNSVEGTYLFTDDFSPATSGSPATNGPRFYRIHAEPQ